MKKTLKQMIAGGMLAVMLLGSAFTAQAAGPQVDAAGWYWQEDDGSRAVNSWKDYNGNRYYFGEDGYMYVSRWAEIPYYYTYTDPATGLPVVSEYPTNYNYLFDASGALVTSGNWEGGGILADGRLWIDEGPFTHTGVLTYWRDRTALPGDPVGVWVNVTDADGVYAGNLVWKNQMMQQWTSLLTGAGYGTYTMDFQLPANYAEECPGPLMTEALRTVCAYEWEDGNWRFEWRVDGNFVNHIVAVYEPYPGEMY